MMNVSPPNYLTLIHVKAKDDIYFTLKSIRIQNPWRDILQQCYRRRKAFKFAEFF